MFDNEFKHLKQFSFLLCSEGSSSSIVMFFSAVCLGFRLQLLVVFCFYLCDDMDFSFLSTSIPNQFPHFLRSCFLEIFLSIPLFGISLFLHYLYDTRYKSYCKSIQFALRSAQQFILIVKPRVFFYLNSGIEKRNGEESFLDGLMKR